MKFEGQPPESGPNSFEDQFEQETKLREQLTKEIAACRRRGDLIEVLSKYQTLPGTEQTFDVGSFLEEVKIQEEDQTLYFGKDEDFKAQQKERYKALLKKATRSFGLRKKWAEILGIDHLFEEDFLSLK